MGKGSTVSLIGDVLRDKAVQFVEEEGMDIDAAIAAAMGAAEADAHDHGPNANEYEVTLERIWQRQRRVYPSFTRPRLIDNPDEETHERHRREINERANYSETCRTALVTALSDRARQYLTFYATAKKFFDLEALEKEGKTINSKRWIDQLIMIAPSDGDAETCRRHNETVVMLTACCEKAITPEQLRTMRHDWYIKEGYTEKAASDAADHDAENAPRRLYELLIDRVEDGRKYIPMAKDAAKSILNGSASSEPAGLFGAYRTLMIKNRCQLMFNMKDNLEELRLFGLDITEDEIVETTRKYEKVSSGLSPLQTLAGQIANPYYAILDGVELVNKGVTSIMNMPGQDPLHSYMYDYSTETMSSGLYHLLLKAEQKELTRFDMQTEIGEHGSHDIDCEGDPTVKAIKQHGRTIIMVREQMDLKDGEFHVKLNTNAPGRMMDATLISDVLTLKEKCAAIPKIRFGRSGEAYRAVRDAIEGMVGMTLGDKAEKTRLDELENKIKALKTASATFGDIIKRKGLGEEYENFTTDVDEFVKKKEDILKLIKAHNETMGEVKRVEEFMAERKANGWKVPEDQQGLTPYQQFLKPRKDEEKARALKKKLEAEKKEAEEKQRQLEEDIKEGERVENAIGAADEKYRDVAADESWANAEKVIAENKTAGKKGAEIEDPVDAMIAAYVEGNSQMGNAYLDARKEILAGRKFEELSPEEQKSANEFGEIAAKRLTEAFAADTVKEFVALASRYGVDSNRLKNILKKGGLDDLIGMVKDSPHFQKGIEGIDLTETGVYEKQKKEIGNFQKRTAMYILRGVDKMQKNKKAVGNPELNAGEKAKDAEKNQAKAQPAAGK